MKIECCNALFPKILLLLFCVSFPGVAHSELESYTHRLSQSTSSLTLWTTLPSEKVFKESSVPSSSGSHIKVYAAQNEFEPFLLIVRPSTTSHLPVSFSGFGSGIKTELYQVKYVNISSPTDYIGTTGPNPDPLWPIQNGETISVSGGENCALWFSIHIPKNTPAGDYSANVTVGTAVVPVNLHVFNFAIPDDLHVKSQMNVSYSTILTKYGVSGTGSEYWSYVDKMKQFFIDHRMTPKSVLWSGGLTSSGGAPYIDYDCAGGLNDPHGIWGFEQPSERYLDGFGDMSGRLAAPFNDGTGFPSFMAVTFSNNDASADQRPDLFCGSTRTSADWYTGNNPGSNYNSLWFDYMESLQNYLDTHNYLDRAYYYFANEPQNQEDYDAVAWYSQELKKKAPHLKLMVSEEPKAEIFDHPIHTGAKVDIWLAHLGSHFNPDVSFDRMLNHNEETWIYFLHGTRLPRFNPLTIDHPGIEGKLLGWFLWKYRLRGFAYYKFNDWNNNPWTSPRNSGQNGNLFLMYPPSENNSNIAYGSNDHRFVPSIRVELMRDGLEDYEYFYLLSGSQQPQPFESNSADEYIDKIIGYTVAYNRDSELLYNIRRLVGLKLGGEIAAIGTVEPRSQHSRSDETPGNYYINFQNPAGEPFGTVTNNGNTYIKIGDTLYDPLLGYGWMKAAEVPDADFYPHWDQWIDPEPKKLLGSSVINSWGREDVFEFDLPNGTYNVTACAGSRSSPRYQNIVIEGVVFMDDEETNNSWITRTEKIEIRDKKLTLVMGKFEKIGYINYLDIEATYATSDVDCSGTTDVADVITLLQILRGKDGAPGQCPTLNGDMNGDGRLGMEDALMVLGELR